MGKVGRFACIFTPVAFTVAAFICVILVCVGGWNSNSSTETNMYFFRARIENSTYSTALNVSDFYTASLYTYCKGDTSNTTGTTKYNVTSCSSPSFSFFFDPIEILNLNDSDSTISDLVDDLIPDSLEKAIKIDKKVSHWLNIAYLISIIFLGATLALSAFALCSRLGSLITTITSSIAAVFTLAASITATALYATITASFNSALKDYGIHGSMGRSAYIATWFGTVFACAASIFWLLSSCCCSGQSSNPRKNRGFKVEKTPYTYERVESPYGASRQSAYGAPVPGQESNVPLQNVQQGGYHMGQQNPQQQKGTAYEPFRHEHV
ncbi:MAG: hypothetical protein M1834_003555 [Cirrosporium novae-zelandiae]|nr:MAG: hypothetical protein M1834_003555 [Cirrosporium novae-zelandiae]